MFYNIAPVVCTIKILQSSYDATIRRRSILLSLPFQLEFPDAIIYFKVLTLLFRFLISQYKPMFGER